MIQKIDIKKQPVLRTLVIGGTGKTGRRVAARLKAKGVPVRIGSRTATPSFDWNNPGGWDHCIRDMEAVFISYAPDLAVPGATDSIRAFVERARQHGVRRIVLLSGRGEPEAQACERIVLGSGIGSTIVRASWFSQNFSEGAFVDMITSGVISLPAGKVPEPFVDLDDVADVAAVALTEPGHAGEIYEVTGPRLMTFGDVAAELSQATGRTIRYQPITHDEFLSGLAASGAPPEVVWLMGYLFSTIMDGRNARTTDGVERALGRGPRDFASYALTIAASSRCRKTA